MINILKEKDSKLTKEEIYLFLTSYCSDELETSRRKSCSEESFANPAWAEYQAYQLGVQKAVQKILNLIPDPGKFNDN